MTWDNINWRTFIAAVVWILNLAAILVYILTYDIIEPVYSKLIYLYSCVITLIYAACTIANGFESKIHRGFIILSFSSLCVFFILLILYYQFGFGDYKFKIGIFIATELLTICFVFISGLKLGLFKNERDML